MRKSTRNAVFFTGMIGVLAAASSMADVKSRAASQATVCQDVQLMAKLIMELRQDGQSQQSTQTTINRAFNQDSDFDRTSLRVYTRINEQAYQIPVAPTAAGKQAAVTSFQQAARQSCLAVLPET